MRSHATTQLMNHVCATWKWYLSLFKSNWDFSDYPISVHKLQIDPSIVSGRLKQHRYAASIVNWWVINGVGDTKAEALQKLQENFTAVRIERAKSKQPLPRPGTHVDIEFTSQARIDTHSALADEFVRRVLSLDWAWISDESTLWDFHTSENNQALVEKIKEVYGVDVSDIQSAKLWEILERIASTRISS